MKGVKALACVVVGVFIGASPSAFAVEAAPTELACADFKPTAEAAQRFADLRGACESVVEIDGRLYGKFRAVVRRASSSSVTLNLPQTDHTFTIKPDSDARVLIGTQKVRPRDLSRGQEIRIYLPIDRFAQPAIEEVALVQEDTSAVVAHEVVEEPEPERVLPATASPLPLLAIVGAGLLLLAATLRRIRRSSV